MESTLFKKGLVLLVLLLFIGAGVVPSTVGIIDKTTTISNSGSRGYIQDLIDNASDGDTIYIPSGVYYENIIIDKSINLVGEDEDTTIIDGGGSGNVLLINADDIKISCLTIRDGSNGININSNNNIIIEDNIIEMNHYGIYGQNVDGIIINNTIFNNNVQVIKIYWPIKNTIISNNYFYDNDYGLYLVEIQDSIIKNNVMKNMSGHITLHDSLNVKIINNTFIDGSAIYLAQWNYNTIIENNTFNTGTRAILISRAVNVTIRYNEFSNYNYVIYGGNVKCIDNVIFRNKIYNNNKGIWLDNWDNKDKCYNNSIIENTIFNNYQGLIITSKSTNNTIFHNNFINNSYHVTSSNQNLWDNGYPSGGNYWDDYNGTDGDSDGIGDTPYNITGDINVDRYPLMHPYGSPHANFTYTPSNPNTQTTIQFNDTSSDYNGIISSWLWDFGDGNTSNLQNPTHQYNNPSKYTVILNVSDDDGATDEILKNITILNIPPNIPNSPSPSNGSIDVSITEDLSWIGGDIDPEDIVTYDVYFEINDSSPDMLVSNNQSNTDYNPGIMNSNTQYYWQIVSWDNHGASAIGPVWSFTTENNPPNTPSNPSPSNGSINVSIEVDLNWTCSDPEGDNVTYDVYFGDENPPPQVSSGQNNNSYDPGTLGFNIKYYWEIIAKDIHGETASGPIWDFTTRANNPPNSPYNPNPSDGATGVDINADLSWSCSDPNGDDLSYDVYFEANDPTPDELVSNNQTETTFDLETMEYETQYYWQIVAWDEYGASTTGPIWDFTTGTEPNDPPDEPSDPNPEDGEVDVSIETVLSWSCSDPNEDTLLYDIYFEADDETPDVLVSDDQTATTFDPGILEYGTVYYWRIIAKDEHSATSTGPVWSFTTISNSPPSAPTISGPTTGKPGQSLTFTFNSVDPEGHDVRFLIDWGDTNSDTTDYVASGSDKSVSHIWVTEDTFTITAKAEDEFGLTGPSATFTVTIPRNKAISNPILNFLQSHPNMFPLLQKLIGSI